MVDSNKISVIRFRTGSNLLCAHKLSELVKKLEFQEAYCYIISTILVCDAALESALFEYAYHHNKTIYDEENFKITGIYHKYKLLFDKKLKKDFPEVPKLIAFRNAITHNEPDNQRETILAKELSIDTAKWAVEITEEFTEKLLGKSWINDIKKLY